MRNISIEDLKQNTDLTVAEYIKKLQSEEKTIQEQEDNEFDKIKTEFNESYIKRIYNCSLFGETLEVLYIKEVVSRERTVDWDFIYKFKGTRISFSKRDINKREINEKLNHKTLQEFEKISYEEYLEYFKKYGKITSELNEIIK